MEKIEKTGYLIVSLFSIIMIFVSLTGITGYFSIDYISGAVNELLPDVQIFTSMIFMLIKSISLKTITGTLLTVLASILVFLSAVAGYYLFLQIRKNYPQELTDRKKKIESRLIEIFTNDNFPERNFGTGELYEYLFQYFEDFLSVRELQNELSSLNRGGGSRISLPEREEKLRDLTERKDKIQQEIESKLSSLDINIHPVPEKENIKSLIPEIKEMIDR